MRSALQALCDDLEPAAAWAAALLRETDPRDHVEVAVRALRSARDYAVLLRTPRYGEYLPRELIANALSGLDEARYSSNLAAIRPCIGDPDQLSACLRQLLGSCELGNDAQLLIEASDDAEPPQIRLTLDGPGRFRSPYFAGNSVRVRLDVIFDAWTRATRGGRIDSMPNGFELRLAGVRVPLPPIDGADDIASAFEDAEHRLRLVAADAAEVGGESALPVVQAAVFRCLELLDAGSGSESPADFGALFRDAFEQNAHDLDRAAIAAHVHISPRIPALAVRRVPLTRFWKNVFRTAFETLQRGGVLSIVADYAEAQQSVEIIVSVAGGTVGEPLPALAASMRRAIIETHAGQLAISRNPNEILITAEIPDSIGRALAARVPEFGRFSARSVQLLRLVTGGNSGLPEDAVLASVLEEELERWLLPYLSTAPAANLAHEIALPRDKPDTFSEQRFAKAMAQIRRGKPKKEICRPPYAGEVVWTYASEDRYRAAIGAQGIDEKELKELAARLLMPEPPVWECLRTISKVSLAQR